MATQPDFDEEIDPADIAFEEPDDEPGDQAEDAPEGEEDEESEPSDEDDLVEDDDGDVITFGGAEVHDEDEPEGLRNVREALKRERARVRELEARLTPAAIEDVGPEPNIDDYWERDDPQGEFKKDLLAWNERQRDVEKRQEQQQQANQAIQQEFEADVAEYGKQRDALKVRDFDTADERVTAALDESQIAILTSVARNKAALRYGLGKNPDKLATLAKIKNYVKFAGEVARLDMETHVARKPTTQPERPVRGSGTFSGGNAKMERLEREASASGDRSKVVAYRRELRVAGKL